MADASRESPPGGFTLDLSTGAAPTGRRKRTGPPPVVVQTINLSTPRASAPASPTPAAPPEGRTSDTRRDESTRPRGGSAPRRDEARGGRTGSGTSLSDLLDEATLARLRGTD